MRDYRREKFILFQLYIIPRLKTCYVYVIRRKKQKLHLVIISNITKPIFNRN